MSRSSAAFRAPNSYSDMARIPENEPLPGRDRVPAGSFLIYVNADAVLEAVPAGSARPARPRSAWWSATCRRRRSSISPASHMLHELQAELAARGISRYASSARTARVRDLLRADGLGEKVGGLDRAVTLASVLARDNDG